jgi:hypothetical protein
LAARTRGSNRRATAAVVLGAIAAVALPAGIVVANRSARVSLLTSAWAIPVAAVCGAGALLLARGAKTQLRATLDRAGGHGRVRAAVYLGIAGICFALSGAIAVGFYELLLKLEG